MAKEEDQYGLWMDRINDREDDLRSRSEEWNRYLRFYRQKLTAQENPKGDSVWINYQFALSRIILPSIYYKNPDILCLPARGVPDVYARMHEQLLNYEAKEMGFEFEMRKVVFDALFAGIGVLKVGFDAPTRQPSLEDPFAPVLDELFGSDTRPDGEESYDPRISTKIPFALRISPRFFLIDPLASCLEDARWVCHRVLRPVEQMKKDRKYSKRLTSGMSGTHAVTSDETYALSDERILGPSRIVKGDELVMLYEVWDIEHGKLLVLDSYNMGQGDHQFIREEPDPYDVDGVPFELLVFNADPESPYGVPDAATWQNPCAAMNLLNSMQYNHVKRFTRKYIARKGSLMEGAEDKLIAPYDGVIVEVNDDRPGDCILPLQDATVTPDLYTLRDTLRNELVFISGVTEQRKGAPEKARTATEASLIEQQARIRDSDRLFLVGECVKRTFRKIRQLNRQFLDPTYVSWITGPEALQLWRREAEAIIRADVDVDVRVGSSAYVSKEVQVKQYLDFFNLVGNMQVMGPMGMPYELANKPEFVKRIAEAMGIPDYESLLNQAPVPVPQPSGPPGMQQPGMQAISRRTGSPNLGDMLSNVQNLGVRRHQAPNPTAEIGQG